MTSWNCIRSTWSVCRRCRDSSICCGRRGACAAVDLGHEEDLVAIAAGERLAHADFAGAVVVVPAIVEEGDAAVDGLADELDRVLLGRRRLADVVAAEADGGDALAGAPELAIDHAIVRRGGFGAHRCAEKLPGCEGSGGDASRLHKFAAIDLAGSVVVGSLFGTSVLGIGGQHK